MEEKQSTEIQRSKPYTRDDFNRDGMEIAKSLPGVYQTIKGYDRDIRELEIRSNERIAEMGLEYRKFRDTLMCVFGERQQGLGKHYEVLERAMQSNDKELIIEALRGISSIVRANPLESLEQFTKRLQNEDEPLMLDF